MNFLNDLRRRGIDVEAAAAGLLGKTILDLQAEQETEADVDSMIAETERLRTSKPHTRRFSQPQSKGGTNMDDSKYRDEYAEHKHIHSQLGITEEDYVLQRQIEDGHQPDPIQSLHNQKTKSDKPEFAGVPGLIDAEDWQES